MIFDSYLVTFWYIFFIALTFLLRRFWPHPLGKKIFLLVAGFLVLTTLISVKTLIALSVVSLGCYGSARLIMRFKASPGFSHQTRYWLIGTIVLITLLLIILKYDWARVFLGKAFGNSTGKIDLIESIGVSYIFFKLIHFLVDAYRGVLIRCEGLTFLNYIFFFPTYLSGPIDRYRHFARWMNRRPVRRDVLLYRAAYFRIFIGVIKKLILVPLVVGYATDFGQVHVSSLFWVNVGLSLIAYSFYLYFDFSGYSDMAIGSAMLLGFKVPENFKTPYLSKDIAEFWRRWHISLSSILKDYLFLPVVRGLAKHWPKLPRLTGSICGYTVTFFVCGLWHGNTVNFVVWGLWHGVGISVNKLWQSTSWCERWNRMTQPVFRTSLTLIATGMTFLFVSFGWLFFHYSFPQILSMQDLSRLQVAAQPQYFYGETYTWGIRISHRPLEDNQLDVEYRQISQKKWTPYINNEPMNEGIINIYGLKDGVAEDSPYKNLPPGGYEVRLRHQNGRNKASDWMTIAVRVPDYTSKTNLTADDIEATPFYADEQGWGIQLRYKPPSRQCKVDIDYRPPGAAEWIAYQRQYQSGNGVVKIFSNPSVPGVYCVRVRYTNPREGYFSDWSQISVKVAADSAKPEGKT